MLNEINDKIIHQVEISHLSDDFFLYNKEKESFLIDHLFDDILCIKDNFYTIYFIYNKKIDIVFLYLVKIIKDDIYRFNSTLFEPIYEEKNIVKYQMSRKDFKNFVIHLDTSFYLNQLPEFIFNHYLNYDYNIWNDINDWLNSNLNYKYIKYYLIYIKINVIIPFSKSNKNK